MDVIISAAIVIAAKDARIVMVYVISKEVCVTSKNL